MDYIKWQPELMVEVTLSDPEQFLKIKETLTRIGLSSRRDNTLYQSCHILHKQGHYYIVHFKEIFALDGKDTTITELDLKRRNRIASLLHEWGLCKLVNEEDVKDMCPMSQLKIVAYKDKENWQLVQKYTIGHRK
jgi:hypothetical protein